jgi:CheY-like chemotaxis protein
MGGEITVSSVSGEGSSFAFTLLMDIVEYARDALPEAYADAVDLSGRRLLLVEDIDINRIILTELLADTRIEIEEAADGARALAMFSASPEAYYDIIFMDVQMPNMNGYEATAAIRLLPRGDAESIPILAMTANAYREDIERALEAGMNGHLAKPVDIEEVKKALTQWLRPPARLEG